MLASVISSSAGSVVGTIRCLADIAPAAPTAIAPAIPTTASPTIRPMTLMAYLLDSRPRPTAAGDKSTGGAGRRGTAVGCSSAGRTTGAVSAGAAGDARLRSPAARATSSGRTAPHDRREDG